MTRRKSSGASKREVEMRPGATRAAVGLLGLLGPPGGRRRPNRRTRLLSGAIGNSPTLLPASSNETVAARPSLRDLGSESTGGGETMPHAHHHHHHHGQRLTGRRGFDHAHPRRGLLGGRRSPHGFSAKTYVLAAKQEAYPDEEGGESKGKERESSTR